MYDSDFEIYVAKKEFEPPIPKECTFQPKTNSKAEPRHNLDQPMLSNEQLAKNEELKMKEFKKQFKVDKKTDELSKNFRLG